MIPEELTPKEENKQYLACLGVSLLLLLAYPLLKSAELLANLFGHSDKK